MSVQYKETGLMRVGYNVARMVILYGVRLKTNTKIAHLEESSKFAYSGYSTLMEG